MEFIFFPIHMISLAYAAWNIFRADQMGMSWVMGKTKTVSEAQARTYHKGTWIGLTGLVLSGLGLFWPVQNMLLSNPAFYIKMSFVGALVINGLIIGSLMKVAHAHPFASLTKKQKLPLYISGAVSTIAWLGAGLAAFFLLP